MVTVFILGAENIFHRILNSITHIILIEVVFQNLVSEMIIGR